MDKIVGDHDFIRKLDGGTKHVEVFDADGKLLGRYLPQCEYAKLLDETNLMPEFNEEIRRQAIEDYKAGRGVTTEELKKGFEAIRRSWEQTP